MTAEDFEQLKRVARQLPDFSKIGVFSPWREYEGTLFPKAKALPRWRWDLNKPMPWPQRFDLLVACSGSELWTRGAAAIRPKSVPANTSREASARTFLDR